ncbi:MAG: hypothetical protein RIR91_918 [Verrucomicrobiota bacterium]|jgi:hypothetical protein
MHQTGTRGNTNKNATRPGVVRTLVRLGRRDLGLGQAGLAVVRALVIGGGEVLGAGRGRAEAAGEGEGGGSRFSRGGDAAMGLGRQNLA